MKRKKGRSRHHGGHREGDADEHSKKAKATPDICDDVLLGIFSRLTPRDAARCATLSKRHRELICSTNFWHLQNRLGPPLPRPHVAYLATVGASHCTRCAAAQVPVLPAGSVFLDFHLAGAGDADNKNDELIRYSLIDRRRLYCRYVGTCNGVILMAQDVGASSILLFNPAVAGGEEEVKLDLELPEPRGRCRVVGFGYGPSSRVHKLLLTREELCSPDKPTSRRGGKSYRAKELFVYTLGVVPIANQVRRRSVMSKVDAKISATSVHLDGKIYLLADRSRVLAFDVDDESVTAIDLPEPDGNNPLKRSKLVEVSGRLCVATGRHNLSLWLLTSDQQWVRLCKFRCGGTATKLAGAWDCAGVLLLYLKQRITKAASLHLLDTRDEGTCSKLLVPRPLAPEGGSSELVMCWGYKPTLVSPGSIVGDAPPRQRSGGGGMVAAALKPMLERDVSAGREGTLESVCFTNLLLYIMTKLPDKAHDVIKELKRRSLPFSLR